jgi:hypothetical protein
MAVAESLDAAPLRAKKVTRRMLRDAYGLVRERERLKRERGNEIRQTAWCHYKAATPYAWAFWRVGFLSRFGERLARGADYTCIPGYDCLAKELGTIFPEYQGDDGCERLWGLLLSRYDPMPGKAWLMERAEELAASWARHGGQAAPLNEEAVPF